MNVRVNRRVAAKALTKSKVMLSARALWDQPGTYEAVGIREIAKGAGMSTGAVFANFDSKADLWRAVMGYEPPVDGYGVRQHLMAAATTPQAEAA